MEQLKQKLQDVILQFKKEIEKISNFNALEALRTSVLGKNGTLTILLTELKTLPIENKKELGPLLNKTKQEFELDITQKREYLIAQSAEIAHKKLQNFDVSLYHKTLYGHRHPYTKLIEDIEDIFLSMGYEIIDGPEIETDFYNFTALNIPKDHPARDMYDTFWLNIPDLLLRTHTSPVQVHAMRNKGAPIAAVVPGRCFRHEATDASHDFMFMQCEGIFIDKNVTLAHLFATAQTFLRTLFKKETLDIRIRPGYFPFVEPGIEIDARCPFCKNGCSVCKKSTWIEVFPCGLIHPNVLRHGNIDPEIYSGFAFGFGLTRLAMIKYNINDIRLFHSGKIKFLEQF
jgi:phenylalanyl-tRNA synthetase alpha chain